MHVYMEELESLLLTSLLTNYVATLMHYLDTTTELNR